MKAKDSSNITIKVNAQCWAKKIAEIAILEEYDSELNHLWNRQYREWCCSLFGEITPKVEKKYDCHLHDYYVVDEEQMNRLAKKIYSSIEYVDGKLWLERQSINAF